MIEDARDTDESHEEQDAQGAFKDAIELVRRKQLRPAMLKLLDGLALDPNHRDALASAARLASVLGDRSLGDAFSSFAEDPEDVQAMFDLGYSLVAGGRPDVAIGYLNQCLERMPHQALVRYELAYAYFLSRDFESALRELDELTNQGELSPTEEIEAVLLRAEAEVYSLDESSAREALESLQGPDELSMAQRERVDSIQEMITRCRFLDDPDDLRAWHFVQHASLLVREVSEKDQEGAANGRALIASPGYSYLGGLLSMLRDLLIGVGVSPSRVLYLSMRSRPLAEVLGTLFEIPVSEFDGGDGLVLAITEEELRTRVSELEEIRMHSPLIVIGMNWTRSHPLVPDICTMLATAMTLPWENAEIPSAPVSMELPSSQDLSEEDMSLAIDKLTLAARSLDMTEEVKTLRAWCRERRGRLTLLNRDPFKRRRFFSAHSPIGSHRLIYPS